MRTGRREEGQAALELALTLPLLTLLLLAILQLALIGRDAVLTAHAAREAAREAAVTPRSDRIRAAGAAAGGLDGRRLTVTVRGRRGPGSRATVDVRYRSATDVPLIGPLVGDFTLRSSASMRVEL